MEFLVSKPRSDLSKAEGKKKKGRINKDMARKRLAQKFMGGSANELIVEYDPETHKLV